MQVPGTVPGGYPEYPDPLRDGFLTVAMFPPRADIRAGTLIASGVCHSTKINCVRWSPDEKQVISVGAPPTNERGTAF